MLAAFCLAASTMSFFLVAFEMNKFLDAQLQEIAINVAPGERRDADPLLDAEHEDQLVVRIWDRSGNLVHRAGPPVDIPWRSQPGLTDVVAEGQEWRVYRWSHAQHNIQIAQAWSARREIARFAAAGAALPLLLSIPLAWFIIRRSINRTLRGLHRLSSDIGRRSVDAREPLGPAGVPKEIAPLIVAIDELVERYRRELEAQRRFVADAAHELRTPLAALQIQADNLLASDLSDQSREMANELGEGVRRSSYLASQLLEMARTEGATSPEHRMIDLAALITSILADFVSVAEASDIQFEREIVAAASVKGDEAAIRKLVSILLDNAVRYSPRNGLITVRLLLADNRPKIDILDSGPGITDEAMPFIYDRFFRAAPQEIEGTGLGLAIAKTTADRHDLQLRHANRADQIGTIATIIFPQA
ncbi:ATP-binding protein [Nitrobacter sp. NHB1]|uniref:ATP-binding protein n=1 Tax=Nitrobacter sp. NHB1 TaxID=3119830 RepID=UPI002FFE7092